MFQSAHVWGASGRPQAPVSYPDLSKELSGLGSLSQPQPQAPGNDTVPNPASEPNNNVSTSTTTLHIFRHAEGLHNVAARGGGIPDPYLTTLGLTQCVQVQRIFRQDIDIIIASPMKRTIQTALFCFGQAIRDGSKNIILVPDLQEVGRDPCNTGSPPNVLVEEFGNVIDASRLGDSWYTEGSSTNNTDILDRAVRARQAIATIIDEYKAGKPNLGNINVAIVSHGRFIQYLTGDFVRYRTPTEAYAAMWRNTGTRSYRFVSDTDLRLKETDESSRARNNGQIVEGASEAESKRSLELQTNFQGRRAQAQASGSSIFDF
ncbi:histidine phosphatase superfamily [Annulohypoxylon moriforme]|nr:histidine phosphatase superfamily [Annulohypoxylon moriforme]